MVVMVVVLVVVVVVLVVVVVMMMMMVWECLGMPVLHVTCCMLHVTFQRVFGTDVLSSASI